MTDVLPRHLLRRGQTPQSFRLSTIRAAYAKAAQDPDFTATDDCTVVLRYLPDVPIAVVPGHERNMKVTEPIDVYIADKLFQLTSADHPAGAVGRRLPSPAGRQDHGASSAARTASAATSPTWPDRYGADGADLLPVGHQHPRRAPRGHRRRRPRRCWPRPAGSTSW